MNSNIIKKIDKGKMCEVYDKWFELAHNAFTTEFGSITFGKVNNIIFAGMGGSGTIGDVISEIFSQSNIHVKTIKGYSLPKTVDSNSLVITISISGNTKETLAILKKSRKTKCKIIAFSSGGIMEKYCKDFNIKHIKIQEFHSPRSSLVVFLYSILKVLLPILPLSENEIFGSLMELKKTQKLINSSNLSSKNPALELAKWIRQPLIYFPVGLKPAAIRFKNSLQENAKLHVYYEDVIEASHNGIVAWEKKSNVQPILILGKDDHIMTKERWKIFKKYFNKNKIKYKEIKTVKGNILAKLINLIYILDYCSIYKAIILKIDPTTVKSIDFIKQNIRK